MIFAQNLTFQKIKELPFKDLRSLIDSGKKELNNGVVVVYAIKDNKIGLAVGVTQELSKKIDAVNLVKIGSEIIGGKGGGVSRRQDCPRPGED